jgi:acyl-coenzyme A synthetase/AMP-(fatty) acid ligase
MTALPATRATTIAHCTIPFAGTCRALQPGRSLLRPLGAIRPRHRIAVYTEHEDGRRASHTYAHIQAEANRLSRALREIGVRRGDRVAIVMPQRIETVIAGMAVYQLGAIAMPLSMLFGPERWRTASITARPAWQSATRRRSTTCWPRGPNARRSER